MTVWLYAIVRNEARILPYFLRHYTQWVDKLIFYDDRSDDGTRELISDCPKAELRDWPGTHGIVDDEFLDFANEQWKEARGHADWVVWVDADEFLYHPNIVEVLERYLREGVEAPRIAGYTMFSFQFPTTAGQIYDEIKAGIPDDIWSKSAIFRVNTHWTMGRHGIDYTQWKPKTSATPEIKLLHYRCLGMDYLRERHTRNWARVPEKCRIQNLGTNTQPGWEGHHGIDWFQCVLNSYPPPVI